MIAGSVSALTLIRIRAGFPAAAAFATLRISSTRRSRRLYGATRILRKRRRLSEPRQVVEQVGDVGCDVLVRREEPEVLVDPRVVRVIVARADVDVAAQPVAFPAHDLRGLRVDLQAREPVDDVHAGALELARPLDVPPLVETGLQLDEADALLSVLRGLDQRRHERRLVAGSVHGRLQPDHVPVLRGRADERLERRRERLVGVMDEDGRCDGSRRTGRRSRSRPRARRRRSGARLVTQVGALEPAGAARAPTGRAAHRPGRRARRRRRGPA